MCPGSSYSEPVALSGSALSLAGRFSLAGSVMSGWSAGVASLSLAAGVASAEVSSVCGSSTSGSGVVSGVDVEITILEGRPH